MAVGLNVQGKKCNLPKSQRKPNSAKPSAVTLALVAGVHSDANADR
jgi:hypothetical protein